MKKIFNKVVAFGLGLLMGMGGSYVMDNAVSAAGNNGNVVGKNRKIGEKISTFIKEHPVVVTALLMGMGVLIVACASDEKDKKTEAFEGKEFKTGLDIDCEIATNSDSEGDDPAAEPKKNSTKEKHGINMNMCCNNGGSFNKSIPFEEVEKASDEKDKKTEAFEGKEFKTGLNIDCEIATNPDLEKDDPAAEPKKNSTKEKHGINMNMCCNNGGSFNKSIPFEGAEKASDEKDKKTEAFEGKEFKTGLNIDCEIVTDTEEEVVLESKKAEAPWLLKRMVSNTFMVARNFFTWQWGDLEIS